MRSKQPDRGSGACNTEFFLACLSHSRRGLPPQRAFLSSGCIASGSIFDSRHVQRLALPVMPVVHTCSCTPLESVCASSTGRARTTPR